MKLLSLAGLVAVVSASTISLPSYPLAVRSPYLSTWLPFNQSSDVPNATPEFWAGQPLTWAVLARVNGNLFTLFGCPSCVSAAKPANQTFIEFTSTHTLINLEASGVQFNLDFFSPVDVNDLVRQSLPYSYLTVSANNHGNASIDILSAIDESWTAQNGTTRGTFQSVKSTQIFTLAGLNSIPFTESQDMATYGDVVFASLPSSLNGSLSCASGSQATIVSSFSRSGILPKDSTNFSPGNWVACAHKHGKSSNKPFATFAIGLQRNDAIKYFDGIENKTQTGYFRSVYRTVPEAVSHFIDDYKTALKISGDLDRRVVAIGEKLSKNYADILEASVRQSFGGLEVTIPADTLDTSQAMAFMKEISTDGNVNTVADLIPKASPIFLVLAPEYIRMLLDPVLKYSFHWPLNHVVHDIGKHYPNATGETPCDEEFLPLDSDTVMFWMVYAYQKVSGNTEWVKQYLPLLQKYAEYMVNFGLFPVLQRSSTDSIGAASNQTILAMSAAISLKAFGAISGMDNYTALGDQFAKTVFEFGTDQAKTHFLVHYNDTPSSWVIAYPLAFDKFLELNTFDASVYEMQSNWYTQHEHPFGIQFSNEVNYTLFELEFLAASTSSLGFQHYIVDSVRKFLTDGFNDIPGPTQWNVTGLDQGVWSRFSEAKSIIGSSFMIAAMEQLGGPHDKRQNDLARASPSVVLRADEALTAIQSDDIDRSNVKGAINIPSTVPLDACRPLAPGFMGLSIQTSSFPAYSGNSSQPNVLTMNLISSIGNIMGSNVTVRVGGATGDTAVFDPNQSQAITGPANAIILGPSFFSGFTVFRNGTIQWVWMAPLADGNLDSAVQQSQLAIQAFGARNLYALEVGNEPNHYPDVFRSSNYGCQQYAVQLFQYTTAIRGNVTGINSNSRFIDALDLASGRVPSIWTTEQCFTAGIDAMHNVKTVSSHYYQFGDDEKNMTLDHLMNHGATVAKFDRTTLPEVRYQTETFSCINYVLSEIGVSASPSPNSTVESSLGAAIWAVDFMLYAMSKNVSKVYWQQAVGYAGDAWTPTQVNAPFYALAYIADFVGNAEQLQVVPIVQTDNLTVYAGYELGRLSRIAVVNLQQWEVSGPHHGSARPSEKLVLSLPEDITRLTLRRLTGLASSSQRGITWAGTRWTAASSGRPVSTSSNGTTVTASNGVVTVSVPASEAMILTSV